METKQKGFERNRGQAAEVNILLVDDKPERLLSYEVALESLGHKLVRALSGTEALGLLMKMEFAAILLDVSMPDMDGFETASLIRQHPRFEETPIVFVTGVQVTDVDQLRGYELGAVDYVQIPVVPSILRGKVQALVQLYLHRAELTKLNVELARTNAELAAAHEALKAENTRELTLLNRDLELANNDLQTSNDKLKAEIREREKAEQALSMASQRKDEYIATLAHELRNPLSAIHNAVQVLQIEQLSGDQFTWAKNLLERQVNHLKCLMDDLLDVSRISSGRIQLRLEPVDLRAVVQHTVDSLSPLFEKHRHRLEVAIPEDELLVNGDMVRLTQVLDNLLTNATKYMDDGGLVELRVAHTEGGRATVSVRDHGVGITRELLDKVFDLFVQAPNAINRAEGGLGIGLALVKALVELHGGDVLVHSDGHDRGAEFAVRLPLLRSSVKPKTDGEGHAAEPDPASAQKILIIDDNVDSAVGLQYYLREQGFQVLSCHSGEEGLVAVDDYCPDVVLLDIGLPGLDGFEVSRQLRARTKPENLLKIVAMSGYSSEADKTKARECGFDHYLVKPVNFAELHALFACDSLGNYP